MRPLSIAAAALSAILMATSGASAAPLSSGPTLAPPTPATMDTPAKAVAGASASPLTQPDLDAWLDGYMPYALQRGDVAGAVVVVVKDGKVLFQKGYGYSDVAKRTPVDAATTVFRPGSVSKLFTWTAVMQQVERGKINLDADINTYLDFKMPPGPDSRPITMRDLMTHSAGFEEAIKDLVSGDAASTPKLGALLKRWTPTRIYAAGSTPAYSNYGAALAGYIVERTSGLDFSTYVERNIFQPLGMTHSSFRHDLPPAVAAAMSKGYPLGSGKPGDYEFVGLAPAGSLAATGPDMAAFMIAHLQDGAFGATRILRPETAQMMHTAGRTQLAPLNRMLLGFYETNTNGRRVITHAGDTQYFHSEMNLFLDDGVGLYVALNSSGKEGAAGAIRAAILRQFADRYLPGPGFKGQMDPKLAAEHAKMIAGAYTNTRRMDASLLSITALLGEAKIVANSDGTITFKPIRGLNGVPKKWREIAPFVWLDEEGKSRLAARVENGKVTRIGLDPYPFMVWEPTASSKSGSWLVPAAVASFLAILLTLVLWPITAVVRWRYGARFALSGRDALAHRLVRIGAGLLAVAIGAWMASVSAMGNDLSLLTSKTDGLVATLHLLGVIGVVLGVGVCVWNVWMVWSAKRGWFAKLWSLVLLASTGVLAWLAIAYHLVGWGANY